MLEKWFRKKALPADAPSEAVTDDASSQDAAPEIAPEVRSDGEPSAASAPVAETADAPAPKRSVWARLKQSLTKTRRSLTSLFTGRKLDDAFVDELEAELLAADFGPLTVAELIDGAGGVREAWRAKRIATSEDVREFLKAHVKTLLAERDRTVRLAGAPSVILVAGVNGSGKTTSIAKIAHKLKKDGLGVVLAAGDTFRAAAVEQLTIWSERLGVEIVTGDPSADPASVAFRGAERALETGADVLIVDTAGRLHTQQNLMKELEKIRNVLGKKIPGAPHESLLVLDATTGQNAIQQAESFLRAIDVTGIVLTKLDGTAKGGIVIAINNRLAIPVKYVGVGEQLDDLQTFDPERFVDALFAADAS